MYSSFIFSADNIWTAPFCYQKLSNILHSDIYSYLWICRYKLKFETEGCICMRLRVKHKKIHYWLEYVCLYTTFTVFSKSLTTDMSPGFIISLFRAQSLNYIAISSFTKAKRKYCYQIIIFKTKLENMQSLDMKFIVLW